MVVIFFDNNLERYYTKFKEYFTNIIKVDSQLVSTRRLSDKKRAGSIMFNIVEQINTKMGGINYYIEKNKLISNKIYLVIGLESKKFGNDSIDYVMTYSYNPKMSRTQTIPITCKNNTQDITQTLSNLLDQALNSLHKLGGAPHPPDYIIIFRQGGNHVQNLRYAEKEIPAFLENINKKKEKFESFKKYTKLIYICCNLKGDLKFFEKTTDHGFGNPKSGLCVDSMVTQKDKYEFYLQPQYVNQGSATPCHYQVLYEDADLNNKENNLKMEQLELLSFYLSFYYWTWAGAIRVPGALKLATTAMNFYSKHLNSEVNLPEQKFVNPTYI
jgi:aubergine-like protein